MEKTIDDSSEGAPMSGEEVLETLKTMVFGAQAFERFNAKEREALDKAWNMISAGVCEHDKNVVLGKIRTKIADHCALEKENHCKYCSYCNNVMGVRDILEIIDKCKAESEDKE